MNSEDIPLAFWDHVEELRKALIRSLLSIGIGTLISLLFYKQIFNILNFPINSLEGKNLLILSPQEGVITIFKTAVWAGLTLSSPFWLYFIFQFIAPALGKRQKKLIIPFFLLSILFLGLGSIFALTLTIPIANEYLMSFNQDLGSNMWTLSNYLDYTLILLMANAVAFEACVILLFLVHYRVISADIMISYRRFVIIVIFILSAILTPPDVLTQLMLAIPLTGIYELGILYAKFIDLKSQKRA